MLMDLYQVYTEMFLISLQDFTGVPAVVDLAAMRDAIKRLGGDANKINPLVSAYIFCYLSFLPKVNCINGHTYACI